jgi:hypothetical protein
MFNGGPIDRCRLDRERWRCGGEGAAEVRTSCPGGEVCSRRTAGRNDRISDVMLYYTKLYRSRLKLSTLIMGVEITIIDALTDSSSTPDEFPNRGRGANSRSSAARTALSSHPASQLATARASTPRLPLPSAFTSFQPLSLIRTSAWITHTWITVIWTTGCPAWATAVDTNAT